MLGVIKLILDSDDGSTRGEDDFFSVARTMPLVARRTVRNGAETEQTAWQGRWKLTFDAESCYTLVDCIQGVLYIVL